MKSLLTRSLTGFVLISILFVALQFPLLFVAIVAIGSLYLLCVELPLLLKHQSLFIKFITIFSILKASYWLIAQALTASSQTLGALTLVLVSAIVFDTASYLIGSLSGRHKIAPKITPGKTWEGLMGGMSVLFLFIMLWLDFKWRTAFVYTLLLGSGAFMGDLYESWLKRKAGLKDSGELFPGHGGLYDRVDSLIGAILVYVLLV